MTWIGKTFVLNDILTAAQMNALQADITAQANGDTGAPKQQTAGIEDLAVTAAKLNTDSVTTVKIEDLAVTAGKIATETITTTQMGVDSVDQSEVAASAIHQSELSVQTEEDTTTSAYQTFTLSSGGFGFVPLAKISVTSSNQYICVGGVDPIHDDGSSISSSNISLVSSYVAYLTLGDAGSGLIAYGSTRYVDSSPPYDLGDGEIPLFVWVKLDSSDNIISVQTSITPPWAYNGPTDIRADRVDKQKRKFKRIRTVDEDTGEVSIVETEISMEMKNRDMILLPHPFATMDAGDKVILLDAPDTLYLRELKDAGESINDLLHDDYLRLDNGPINRFTPEGVIASRFRWKHTTKRAGEAVEDKRLGRGPFA